ncbi:hypothetical protein SAMN04490179_4550 [Pseudomonas antarctica]|uniref:Uncharacterized protein n=1 Tax=Pseudomonas antarctica TaxID=219572 RepID=A0A1H0BY23_9PSED|nr:hypothetical protein [Pseudomonas antarctica]KAF2406713.1 hypothetical protein PSAN_48900 [Pseudomonas antarctica]SDN50591.1 hypothetical protein SAMN04490179_4550 [Pseudomonas antarctica]
MPLTPSPNPVFSASVPALTTSSVAHPDTWNPIHQALLDNDAAINKAVGDNKAAADLAIDSLDERLGGVESSSAVSVQKAVDLDWLYRNNVVRFEMFVPGYTLIDLEPITVVQGVNGDDSIDLASTSQLRPGGFYVLSDTAAVDANGDPAPASALVQVQTVLSAARIRLAANLSRDWGPSATLRRSSIKVLGASRAAAMPGDIYLTRSVNIGTDTAGGAVVIRRSLNSGMARLYYRDGYQPTWKETGWSLRRTDGDIPTGYADYEYILPMRGDGWLRLDISGEAMSIAHLVALGTPTGLGGFINPDLRPATPLISTPAAAAAGVMERPTLALVGYSSPSGNTQAAVQFQLSTTAAFVSILHDSGVLDSGLSYALPAAVLVAGTTYYWRARVQDVAGLWSDYSAVSSFATAASFVYVAAPSITGPAANAVDVPEQPTLTSSPFVVSGGADTHAASQWRIRTAAGTYAAPAWDSGTDAVNKLTVVVPAGKLLPGQLSHYLQVRHQGTAKGWSEWSTESKITTKAQFANVIGIALLATGGGAGTWARVDENGVTKVTDASFFSSHATYGAIQDQVVDSQNMVRIPAFYVKRGTIASGANFGKKAVWISDQSATGFTLHPAFKNAGADLGQFWVGKYQGTTDGAKLGSKPGLMPLASIDFPNMQARAAARNTAGVSGFALWSIYQLSAIQTLAMIEMGGADSQALIGQGNVSTSAVQAVDSTTVAQATWRGIVGLWGNVWQMVDGLQTDASNRFKVWGRNGNKSYLTTTRTGPGSGYVVTMAEDAGVDYDLRDIFAPATIDGSASNGSYGDYVYSAANAVAYHGGGYGDGSNAGLFFLNVSSAASDAFTIVGGRLAKV